MGALKYPYSNFEHAMAVSLTPCMYKLLKFCLKPPNDIGPIKIEITLPPDMF